MKIVYKLLAIGFLSVTVQTSFAQKKLITSNDSLSYALGLDISMSLKNSSVDTLIVPKLLAQGLIDGLTKTKGLMMNPDSVRSYLAAKQSKLLAQQKEAKKKKYLKNIVIEKSFLDENSKKDSVVTLPSGLQYKIIKQGTGNRPTEKDEVTVHYKGMFIDGKVFDSSYDRNEPVTFPVKGVIKGWTEALLLMNEGSHWIIYVPYSLAYGEDGVQDAIDPYSTLIFEVELIKIPKAKEE